MNNLEVLLFSYFVSSNLYKVMPHSTNQGGGMEKKYSLNCT